MVDLRDSQFEAFLDECTPPGFVNEIEEELNFEVLHPQILGIRGFPDSRIVEFCLDRGMSL